MFPTRNLPRPHWNLHGVVWTTVLAFVWGPQAPPAWSQTDASAPRTTAQSDDDLATVFANFLHFARLGRFDAADSFAVTLLKHRELTPLKLLEIADQDPKTIETLTTLIGNTSIGDNAGKVLEVIRQGEYERRKDHTRINGYIESLGGPPQGEFNAIQHLQDSGEYAIPWMIQALGDPGRTKLHNRIVKALPKIGKGAVNPLVMALNHRDESIRITVIDSLGGLGYMQAVPYLSQLMEASSSSAEVKRAGAAAVDSILKRRGAGVKASISEQFVKLADEYYREETAVRADVRWPTANVWYWNTDTGFLEHTVVPQEIFGPVMAMRCSEEALGLDPANRDAMTLWLASNIRREGRLGLDVESGDPAEKGEAIDETRPDGFPRALYFTQTAGAEHAQRVLARAVADADSGVALGAIEALRTVAGASSLIDSASGESPLLQALSFPSALVRMKAALALAEALPETGFRGADLVAPTLAEAVAMPDVKPSIVVIDPDSTAFSRLLTGLKTDKSLSTGAADLYAALDRARREAQRVSAFVISAELATPRLDEAIKVIRSDVIFASTPIVILTKPQNVTQVEEASRSMRGVDRLDSAADAAAVLAKINQMTAKGGGMVSDAVALELALQAAEALRGVAENGRTAFDIRPAEQALADALASAKDESLRTACAEALAGAQTPSAQDALAAAALEKNNSLKLRVSVYGSLAESAKWHGSLLSNDRLDQLVKAATEEPDLVLRTAASQALGALNVGGNRASEAVRKYHRG